MAKKSVENQSEPAGVRNHQRPIWVNFDQCWASCVRGGDAVLKQSAKAHLQSIGKWEDQTQWIDGLIHFGIPIEK